MAPILVQVRDTIHPTPMVDNTVQAFTINTSDLHATTLPTLKAALEYEMLNQITLPPERVQTLEIAEVRALFRDVGLWVKVVDGNIEECVLLVERLTTGFAGAYLQCVLRWRE
ncbi:MAG: hypothetical protein M1831_007366 [Alyxoria varia]|nr:MAG: hypothetical protein M1831_007366 [Alyxoria varia]